MLFLNLVNFGGLQDFNPFSSNDNLMNVEEIKV